MIKNSRLYILLILPVLLLQQACVVVPVEDGAATYTHMSGIYKKVVDKNINTVYDASLSAIADLHLAKISDDSDGMTTIIIARNVKDEKITITLDKRSETMTQISIHVGLFGEQTSSQFIMNEIQNRLN